MGIRMLAAVTLSLVMLQVRAAAQVHTHPGLLPAWPPGVTGCTVPCSCWWHLVIYDQAAPPVHRQWTATFSLSGFALNLATLGGAPLAFSRAWDGVLGRKVRASDGTSGARTLVLVHKDPCSMCLDRTVPGTGPGGGPAQVLVPQLSAYVRACSWPVTKTSASLDGSAAYGTWVHLEEGFQTCTRASNILEVREQARASGSLVRGALTLGFAGPSGTVVLDPPVPLATVPQGRVHRGRLRSDLRPAAGETAMLFGSARVELFADGWAVLPAVSMSRASAKVEDSSHGVLLGWRCFCAASSGHGGTTTTFGSGSTALPAPPPPGGTTLGSGGGWGFPGNRTGTVGGNGDHLTLGFSLPAPEEERD